MVGYSKSQTYYHLRTGAGLKGKDEIEVMYKLIVAALQTDSTRVMTYRMPGQALLQSMGVTLSRTQRQPLFSGRTNGCITSS